MMFYAESNGSDDILLQRTAKKVSHHLNVSEVSLKH
jgi:hypothetical protein